MLIEEGGMEVLDRLDSKPHLYFKVRNLVGKIREIMERNINIAPEDDDY